MASNEQLKIQENREKWSLGLSTDYKKDLAVAATEYEYFLSIHKTLSGKPDLSSEGKKILMGKLDTLAKDKQLILDQLQKWTDEANKSLLILDTSLLVNGKDWLRLPSSDNEFCLNLSQNGNQKVPSVEEFIQWNYEFIKNAK